MPRVRKGAARAQKHKKVLKSVRGHIGVASRRYHVALEARMRAGRHAFHGRKLRKRDFRSLWITRISAACRQRGLAYSRFMHALGEQGVDLNRRVLADLAVADPGAFDRLVGIATGQVEAVAVAEAEPLAEPSRPAPVIERAMQAAQEKPPAPSAPRETAAPEAPGEQPGQPPPPAPAKKPRARRKPAAKKPKPET
jgi:large subunit ribosomal protein L20